MRSLLLLKWQHTPATRSQPSKTPPHSPAAVCPACSQLHMHREKLFPTKTSLFQVSTEKKHLLYVLQRSFPAKTMDLQTQQKAILCSPSLIFWGSRWGGEGDLTGTGWQLGWSCFRFMFPHITRNQKWHRFFVPLL